MLILHISDIHFNDPLCQTDQDPELYFRDELVTHAANQASELGDIDAILVTGDIAFKGTKKEFETAAAWLEGLAHSVGSNKRRIYVVPGNHDVDRSVFKKVGGARNAVMAIASANDNQAREKELTTQLALKDSADSMFEPIANYNLFAAKYDCQSYPNRLRWSTTLRIDRRTVLKLHGLNSTLVSGLAGNDTQGSLFMGALQLNVSQAPGTVNLVMAHHPPEWMSDQADIETRLLGAPNIVLFGHKHIQKVHRDLNGPIILSAGSVNPDRYETGWEPAYNFIEIKPLNGDRKRNVEVFVSQFRWQSNPNGFVPKFDIETRETVFRHTITVQGEDNELNTEALGAQPEKGKEMVDPTETNNEMPSLAAPSVRDLIYRFWDLSKRRRRAVLELLGVDLSETTDASEPMSYRKALVELSKQNRLNDLAAAIAKKESES